jgi:hypothetical protein
VLGLEVSRLARNNADWHRLLEICALTQTLTRILEQRIAPWLVADRHAPPHPATGPGGWTPGSARWSSRSPKLRSEQRSSE